MVALYTALNSYINIQMGKLHMIIEYGQGILSKPTLPDMTFTDGDGNISIRASSDAVVLAFAYGKRNYLHTIQSDVNNAWSVPLGSPTTWLYWELNKVTGSLEYGTTNIYPLGYGTTLPQSPPIGTFFFDQSDKKMKFWTGGSWVERLILVAAKWESGTLFEQGCYTQAGLYGRDTGGHIVYDKNGVPIFNYEGNESRSRYFVVTGSTLDNISSNTRKTSLDKLQLNCVAGEAIQKNSCVVLGSDGSAYNGSRLTDSPIMGLAADTYSIGDTVRIISSGFVVDRDSWNWSEEENTNLFVGDSGELTPVLDNAVSSQIIASIVSPNTILINIQEKITMVAS